MNKDEYEKTYLNTSGTVQIFTGKGKLHTIVINTTAAGLIGVIDGVAGTTPNVASIKASILEQALFYDCTINTGLRLNLVANSDITVTWARA